MSNSVTTDTKRVAYDGEWTVLRVQPFDKGPHYKRYEDTIAPAIIAADLEPYRVDRDDGAVIPIDTLHDEIRSAAICLADITTRNPDVMSELGYAIASGKDVVLICSTQQPTPFPFDIQHRGVIQYALDSASDFEQLQKSVTSKIKSLLKKQAATQDIETLCQLPRSKARTGCSQTKLLRLLWSWQMWIHLPTKYRLKLLSSCREPLIEENTANRGT